MVILSQKLCVYLNVKTILSHSEKAIANIQSNKVLIQDENVEFKIGLANTLSQTHKERILWVLKKNNFDKEYLKVSNSNISNFGQINWLLQNKKNFLQKFFKITSNSFTESILKKSQNFDFFPIMYNLLQKKIRRTIYLTYTRNHRLKYYWREFDPLYKIFLLHLKVKTKDNFRYMYDLDILYKKFNLSLR